MTVATEIGDIRPFHSPRRLMAHTGLKENPHHWYALRRTRDPRLRHLQTDLCVCGNQPADISLSHRRRGPLLTRKTGPRGVTMGPPRTGLTPAVPYHLYIALMRPQVRVSTGTGNSANSWQGGGQVGLGAWK